MKQIGIISILLLSIVCFNSCRKKDPIYFGKLPNVIIIVIDGPRNTEFWNDSTQSNIPFLRNNIAPNGVIYNNFRNAGPTYTNAGHTAISTGYHQEIQNGGLELPKYPGLFQYFLEKYELPAEEAWVIASKDKIEILANCELPEYKDKYIPNTNCGNDGGGVGSWYRDDSLTVIEVKQILNAYTPKLTLINLREPDYTGHQGNWNDYLSSIKRVDSLTYEIYKEIKSIPVYNREDTYIFITNDHGRHLDGVSGGFVSHGDNCEGCRHIFCYCEGPDVRKSLIISNQRNQTDITATVAKLFDLDMPFSQGQVMQEIFE